MSPFLARRLRIAAAAPLVALAMGLAACDRSATEAAVEPGVVIAEMVLVDGGGNVMYSHGDHWHGFPVVPAGGTIAIEQYFVARGTAAGDHETPPREEWFTLGDKPAELRTQVVVTDQSLVAWSGDRVRGAFAGQGRSGATSVTFIVYRGTTTLRQMPALPIAVR